jgi:hypothetical protein
MKTVIDQVKCNVRFILIIFVIHLSCLPSLSETNAPPTSNFEAPIVDCVRPGTLPQNQYISKRVDIQLNQHLWIDVAGDLDGWVGSPNKRSKLVPCLNGVLLSGIYPENPDVTADTNFFGASVKVYHLRFLLNRQDDANKKAWKALLNRPGRKKPLTITLAKESGEQMETLVTPGPVDPQTRPTPAYLVVIPTLKGIISLFIIAGSLFLFFILAYSTDVLRDTASPKRPDDAPCFSLGRTQMAFWLFLVLTSFLLLWVVTGDVDTITTSVLGLIGISAGTALGSAVIDSAKTGQDEVSKQVVRADLLGKPPDEILKALKADREQLKKELVAVQTERSKLSISDQAAVDGNKEKQIDIRNRLARVNWQIDFFSMKPWKVVMYDLLGDKESISFHRFQIFVWTIVLGFIFVSQVYGDLTMPEFSGTLLGLMGVSAGTFIGFKLPDQKSAASA